MHLAEALPSQLGDTCKFIGAESVWHAMVLCRAGADGFLAQVL